MQARCLSIVDRYKCRDAILNLDGTATEWPETDVIIGNPPYNVGQLNENDNNKNRKYAVVEQRVKDTYAKASRATNKRALTESRII